jgi:CBS-domain-containing membrane protein
MRFHSSDRPAEPAISTYSPHFERLMSRDFQTISAAAGCGQVAQRLLSLQFKSPLYVLDHEGQVVGTIDVHSLEPANLGAMPIEAAKAADIARTVLPIHSHMSEQEVLSRLAEVGNRDLPVIDAGSGRLIGVIVQQKLG